MCSKDSTLTYSKASASIDSTLEALTDLKKPNLIFRRYLYRTYQNLDHHQGGRGASSAAGNRLQALLNAGFPSVYELPPDADDEAMMELAMALSQQEQGEEAAMGLHHLLGEAIENGGPVDEGEGSSSSASGMYRRGGGYPGGGRAPFVQYEVWLARCWPRNGEL